MSLKTKNTCIMILLLTIAQGASAMDNQIRYDAPKRLPSVSKERFDALDIHIGTVITAEENKRARVPSLRVVMDFGNGFDDLKQSSAQLRENYCGDENSSAHTSLLNKQIAAVTNFPKRSVGIKSFFLTLGVVTHKGDEMGTVVVSPAEPVQNGAKIVFLHDDARSLGQERLAKAQYERDFAPLDIRVGTIQSCLKKQIWFGDELGQYNYSGDYPLFEDGMQVLRVINLMEDQDNILGIITKEGQRIPLTVERPVPDGRALK